MLKISHCVIVPSIFVFGLSVQHTHATDLTVDSGTYSLTANETYTNVTISSLAILDTNGHTLTVTGSGGLACAGSIHIDANGSLILNGGGTHAIGGTIALQAASSNLAIANANSTFSGDGQLVGQHDDATLSIASDIALTTNIDVRGGMLVAGPGTFRNYHIVDADNDTLNVTLASNLFIADSDTCSWIASNGVLAFKSQTGNNPLHGDIILSGGGTLDVDNTIVTTGTFALYIGTLSIASGSSFIYSTFDSSLCVNPGTGTPYTVTGPTVIECPS